MNDRVRRRRAAERRRKRIEATIMIGVVVAVIVIVVVIVKVASGGDDSSGPALSPLAKAGKQLAVTHSCVGCHGRNGEGGANHSGPPWVGLFGSTVTLDDGVTVVADEAYLTESIVQPKAKHVAGWGQMPEAGVNPSDLAAIIAYIEALATPVTSTIVTSTTGKP